MILTIIIITIIIIISIIITKEWRIFVKAANNSANDIRLARVENQSSKEKHSIH